MSRRAPAQPDGDDLEVIEVAAAGAPAAERAARRRSGDDGDEDDDDGLRLGSGRRRRLVWLAVAVAAALVAATLAVTTRHDHTEPKSVTLRTSPGDAATAATTPAAHFAIGASVRALHPAPFVLAGDAGAFAVDVARASVTPVPGLSGSAATVIDRNGSVIVVLDGDQRVLVDLTGEHAPLIAGAGSVFPARTPSHFWVTDGASVRDAFGTARYQLPRGDEAIAEVDGAVPNDVTFLVRVAGENVVRWSPRHGMFATPLLDGNAHIVAVRHDRIAWTGADCGALRCAVHLTDIATGKDALLGLPLPLPPDGDPVARGATGRFSPDGRFLAVFVAGIASASVDVVVFDVASGKPNATVALYDPTAGTPPLPFDWSRNSTSLTAIEAGESPQFDRLVVVDARTGDVNRSGDALPRAASFVTLGLPPATAPSPPLPAAVPLLGAPSGITLVHLNEQGDVQQLDLDTGRVSDIPLRSESDAPFAPPPGTGKVTTALDNGVIVIDVSGASWVPRTGTPHYLGHADSVFRESGRRAWLSWRADDGTYWLTSVGPNGEVGIPMASQFEPWAATPRGLIELDPTRRGPPSIVLDRVFAAKETIVSSGTLLAAGGDEVVWQSADCADDTCPTHVRNLATGATVTLDTYSRRWLSLAPDGHAIVYEPLAGGGSGLRYDDLMTGFQHQLPNATGVGDVVWAPGGWLFYNTEDGVAAWRPGLTSPIALPDVLSLGDSTAAL